VQRFTRLAARSLLAAAVFACGASSALAYYGTFDPDLHEYSGPQLITFVDTDAAPLHCIRLAAKTGDVGNAVLGMVVPMVACTREQDDQCTIVAPLRPGVGQVIAVAGLMTGPDAMLGHELRHCRDKHFHPDGVPFAGKGDAPAAQTGSGARGPFAGRVD